MEELTLKEKRNDTLFLYEVGDGRRCSVILDKDLSAKIILRAEKKKCILTLYADKPKDLSYYWEILAKSGFSTEIAATLNKVIIRWAQIQQLLNALDRLSHDDTVYLKALCELLTIPVEGQSVTHLNALCTKELMEKLSAFEEYKDYA